MKFRWRLAGLLMLWLLSACVPPVLTSPFATPTSSIITPTPLPVTTPARPPTLDRSQRAAQQAMLDLARRLNMDVLAIQLESIQPDEFPAGDLGCPQPDGTSAPLPALVTGQRIILKVGDGRYEYHTAGTQVVYCGAH